jgi:putative transposase
MRGFRDPECMQIFLSSVGPIRQHCALKRHPLRASLYRKQLAVRFIGWHRFTEATYVPSVFWSNVRPLRYCISNNLT